ncbi:MAG: hypothetical protein J6S67_18840 [Methanobrevibacter sp.]|nr:hypothetical protein [Methanobrevibacter sp.]
MILSKKEYSLMFGTLVATYSFIGDSPKRNELLKLIEKLDPNKIKSTEEDTEDTEILMYDECSVNVL